MKTQYVGVAESTFFDFGLWWLEHSLHFFLGFLVFTLLLERIPALKYFKGHFLGQIIFFHTSVLFCLVASKFLLNSFFRFSSFSSAISASATRLRISASRSAISCFNRSRSAKSYE